MSKIWVQNVSPNNLHGFLASQLSLTDLTEGLNVIFASNATGKSTLAKSIVSLFQPDGLDQGATVTGTLWNGIAFESLSKRRKEDTFPGFPGRTQDYYLDLPSLLEGLNKDSGVQKIIGDGYDFSEPVKVSGVLRSSEVKAAREALNRLTEARKGKDSLLLEEKRLPDLEKRVRVAQEARSNSECLETLRRHMSWARDRASAKNEIERLVLLYPGLNHQDANRTNELKLKLKELEGLEREREKLDFELSRVGGESMPLQVATALELNALDAKVNSVRQTTALLQGLTPRLATAVFQVENEINVIFHLSSERDPTIFPEVTDAHFSEISDLARVADRERELVGRSNALTSALNDWQISPEISQEELDRNQRKLLAWLEAEPVMQNSVSWYPAALLTLASVLLSLIPSLPMRVLGALAAGAAAIYFTLKSLPTVFAAKPPLAELSPTFAIAQPTLESVTAKLNQIAQAKGRLEVRHNLELMAQTIDAPSELWRSKLDTLGLKCRDPYLVAPLVDAVRKYLQCKREAESLASEVENLRGVEKTTRSDLSLFYKKFGFSCPDEQELEAAGAFRTWIQTHDRKQELLNQIHISFDEMAKFLDSQGVPSSPRREDRLTWFMERVPFAAELSAQLKSIQSCDDKLGSQPLNMSQLRRCLNVDDVGPLDEMDEEFALSLIEAQDVLSGELESRQQEWQDLRARIRHAENEHSLQALELKFRESLFQVEAKWDSECRKAVQSRVAESIRERLMTEELPPLLQRANINLSSFSRGRYRVEFARTPDEQLGILTVSDLFNGKKQPFKQLSTGTKVHTLIALRLALIDEQESSRSQGNSKFPLIADEPMAVSDPESSQAIAEALVQIAKDRQVILFTSQDSDVALMKSLVTDLTIHGLSHQLPSFPIHTPLKVERTKLAPLAENFDPRHPIGALPIGLFFEDAAENPGTRIDQSSLSRERREIVRALERVRTEINRDSPRLVWTDFEDEKWAKTAYAVKLMQFLDESVGDPHKFLALLEKNRSQSFNRNQIEAASSWLAENNFLAPPPTIDGLTNLLEEALQDFDQIEIENVIKMYASVYILNFEPEVWAYSSRSKAPRKSRRADISAPSDAGLFEEFLN